MCAKISLALVFPAAFFHQPVLAPDAIECVVADAQIEFANQAAGAERGQSFAKLEHLRFDVRRSLVRLLVTCPGMLEQSGRPCCAKRRSHLRTVGTVVANSRAVGLMPIRLALSTSRRRGL